MLPAFSPHTVVGRNTSARAEASAANAPTAITNRTASSPARDADPVGEVLLEVGAEQHERADRAGGGGGEDAGGVEAGLRGDAPHAST